MRITYLFVLVIVVALAMTSFLSSCQKTEIAEETIDLGYDYFPTDSAWERIYLVDSIYFNDNNQSSDTFQFLLKEEFAGLANGAGLESHRIVKQQVQFPNQQNWEARGSYFVLKTNQNLQQVVDNQRIIKLVFPIGNVQSWNGNAYNAQGRRNFIWQNMKVNHAIFDTSYTNSITVLEAQINNLIEEILIRSTYVKHLGLVEFTNNNLNIQTTGVSGYKIRQRLISYAKP